MSNQIGNSGHPQVNSTAFAEADFTASKGHEGRTSSGQFQGRVVHLAPTALSIAEEMSEDADLDAEVESESFGEELRKLSERGGATDEDESIDDEDHSAADKFEGLTKPRVKSIVSDDKLHLFLSALREHQPKSQEDVLDQVKKYFADVTEQHEALDKAAKLLGGLDEKSDMASIVTKARDTLYLQQGPAIRAGLNIAADAEEYARSGLASTDELREFYRKSVLDFENVADLFGKIVKLYGKDKFKEALKFLIQAGGADMASLGPSVPLAHLKSVTDQLYDVEVLGNLHRSLDDLLGRIKNLFGEAENGDSFEVMGKILDLTQARWMTADSITKLAVDARVSGVEALIYFLTSLKEIVRLIPLKIYTTTENRGKLIDATQEALDQAIDRDQ